MEDLIKIYLKDLLSFDGETGVFTWKGGKKFYPKSGKQAGIITTSGYRKIRVMQVFYYAHRLAWLMHYGNFPLGQVDHINGIRDDNRIRNLRDVDACTNQQNQRKAQANNRVGMLGVSMCGDKFKAQISTRGKHTTIGVFDSAAEAHAAYLDVKRVVHGGCTI
ncbi:MAG: HNH endonuclease [Rhodoferax sp.]|uniref:HNH endonuclease n=1 Tax=Rhodoferax sp. TaxID=50421 RepID=UPI0017DBE8EF|nr:HNH endonuclease [Rhodoferax sp.]NMM21552.1 HNH endonuclease [Rhodoferax sp.]